MANQFQMLVYEGYLAADPEMRMSPTGKSVTNFRMGSSRQYKNSAGEDVKETTWLKVTAWGKLGEIINQYCGKGSHVLVTGILRVGENGSPNVYTRNDGTPAASYEITANAIRILKGKDSNTSTDYASDDDIPF